MWGKRAWPLLVVMLACHDSHPMHVVVDAPKPDAGPCWPMATSVPKGTLQLGTGETTFVPMPDQVNLVYGPQGGFHVPVRGRMTGLQPGNPVDILDPGNPRSRYRAFLMNGQPAYDYGTCPGRYGYIDDGSGGDITPAIIEARFFECMGPADLFFKQFLVQAEVIDSTGGYAMDQKLVTVLPPVGWPDAGVIDAPATDAGVPDAPACPPMIGP